MITEKVVITGGGGLVGQNLVLLLRDSGYERVVVLDKHRHNLAILAKLNPGIRVVEADLAESGEWEQSLAGADCLIMLHAQITSKDSKLFVRNNITATRQVLKAARFHKVPFIVHASSSVVNSRADDEYTRTKNAQEKMVQESGLSHCVLRPTLMFGWFDPKHLGWLGRFMRRVPIFPIPGNGNFIRQPLYNRDFCRAILWCIEHRPDGAVYDIVGSEEVAYIDIIRTIKRVQGAHTLLVHIPYGLFHFLLSLYAIFSRKPPFTADQLKALTAGDRFSGVDLEKTFGFRPTPFAYAIRETFSDPRYSKVVLKR